MLKEVLTNLTDALKQEKPVNTTAWLSYGRAQFNRDFLTKKINDPEIEPQIVALMQALELNFYQRARFVPSSLTVFQFFKELKRFLNKKPVLTNLVKRDQLNNFCDWLEEKNKPNWPLILFYGFLCLLGVGAFIPLLIKENTLSVFQQLFATAVFVPVLGMLFTLGLAAYSLFRKQEREMTFFQRCRNNFFVIARAALNITASSVLISAVATTTPVAAILNVVAALLEVTRSVVNMVTHLKKKPVNTTGFLDVEKKQWEARTQNEFKLFRNGLIINIISASLLACVVAAWCFMPGGLLISLMALSAIAVIQAGTYIAERQNKKLMARKLEQQFAAIEQEYENLNPETGVELSDFTPPKAPSPVEKPSPVPTLPASLLSVTKAVRVSAQGFFNAASILGSGGINDPSPGSNEESVGLSLR